MAIDSQTRPPLGSAIQQANNISLASLLALQLVTIAAAATLSADKDAALVDATDGALTLTLPNGADAVVGKSVLIRETSGANAVTIAAADSGTIDGFATLVLAPGEAITIMATAVSATGNVTWSSLAGTAASVGSSRKSVLARINLVGGTGDVVRYVNVSGQPLTVVAIAAAISGTLTSADAVVTATIDGDAVTGGVITIPFDGSAAGDVVAVTPSAANVIPIDGVLALTASGGQDAARTGDLSIELSY